MIVDPLKRSWIKLFHHVDEDGSGPVVTCAVFFGTRPPVVQWRRMAASCGVVLTTAVGSR